MPGGQPCGCFDGTHVDGDEEPVALRCWRHEAVPALLVGAPVRTLAEAQIGRLLPAVVPRPAHARVRRPARRTVRRRRRR